MIRLNESWSNYLTAGVFATLATGRTMPWATDTAVTATKLDYLYHLNRSGYKITAPAIDNLLEAAVTYTGQLTAADKSALADMIWLMYHQKWNKLWATLNLSYNPIENYDRTETKEGTETTLETPTNWKDTRTETPTDWKEVTEGATADNTATTESKKYGFNSATAVPEGETVTTAKNKQTTERLGSYEVETEKSGTYENEITYDTEIHVHGNIGVTTSQQMIESERQLWMWDFFNQVFMDVDRVLTIDIY